MKTEKLSYTLLVLTLRVALVALLAVAGWLVYKEIPRSHGTEVEGSSDSTTLQIVLLGDQKPRPSTEGLAVRLYPIDIVAARHEFFAEPRAGEHYYDFLKERSKGRAWLSGKFDAQGEATLAVPPGEWWIYATLPGDEELEWRFRVRIGGRKQLVELTPQNAYLRSKSF